MSTMTAPNRIGVADRYRYEDLRPLNVASGPLMTGPRALDVVRRGGRALVLAIGPMLDPVLAAADTVVPVEPYLAGTSTRLIDEVLSDRPHRTLALSVGRAEQRRHGTPEQHDVLLGLDAAGLRRSIAEFLTLEKTHTKGPVQ